MSKAFKILVIEDNEPDFVLLKKALDMVEDVDFDITCVKNGQEGLDYVFKTGGYDDVETPDLIILDLNLPIKNGFEVLQCLKKDEIYRTIPIIIYSTSDENGDVKASYRMYANSYITKTYSIGDLFDKIKNFGNYWIKSVKLVDKDSYKTEE